MYKNLKIKSLYFFKTGDSQAAGSTKTLGDTYEGEFQPQEGQIYDVTNAQSDLWLVPHRTGQCDSLYPGGYLDLKGLGMCGTHGVLPTPNQGQKICNRRATFY